MRTDLFQENKAIHVSLPKETYVALRIMCYKKGLSLQRVYQEFSRLLAAENPRAVKMIDDLALRKLTDQVQKLVNPPKRGERVHEKVYVEDHDALYALIGTEDDDDTKAI